jgi:hypothetical protein
LPMMQQAWDTTNLNLWPLSGFSLPALS